MLDVGFMSLGFRQSSIMSNGSNGSHLLLKSLEVTEVEQTSPNDGSVNISYTKPIPGLKDSFYTGGLFSM